MAESGERRQPRLSDVTELKAEVATLRVELAEMRGTMGAYSEAAATNPFRGMTMEDVTRLIVLTNVASNDPGKAVAPQVIYDRVQMCEQIGRWLEGKEESPWDKKARERATKAAENKARDTLATAQRKANQDGSVHTATPIPTDDIEAEVARMAEAEAASA